MSIPRLYDKAGRERIADRESWPPYHKAMARGFIEAHRRMVAAMLPGKSIPLTWLDRAAYHRRRAMELSHG